MDDVIELDDSDDDSIKENASNNIIPLISEQKPNDIDLEKDVVPMIDLDKEKVCEF